MKLRSCWLHVVITLAALGVLASLSGCAEQKDTFGAAQIMTDPPGVEAIDLKNNSDLGSTPLKLAWEPKGGKAEYVIIRLRKAGYQDAITSFWINPRYESKEAAIQHPQMIHARLSKTK